MYSSTHEATLNRGFVNYKKKQVYFLINSFFLSVVKYFSGCTQPDRAARIKGRNATFFIFIFFIYFIFLLITSNCSATRRGRRSLRYPHSLAQINDLHSLEGLAKIHFLFSLFVNCSAAACVSVSVTFTLSVGVSIRDSKSESQYGKDRGDDDVDGLCV